MKHESLKARWQRAIDELTAKAMQGSLPDCCAWIQHTSLAWLINGSQQEAEDEEEARWMQLWIEEEARSHGGEALAMAVRHEHAHNHDHIPLLPTQLEDDDSDFEEEADDGDVASSKKRSIKASFHSSRSCSFSSLILKRLPTGTIY